MPEITTVLALFVLLSISSAVFFISKKVRVPYTVLLVLVGLLLVPVAQLPALEPTFGFLDDLVLTPELLFYIFLPMLIFESAFNINVRKILESSWSILSLAVIGLIVSALLIAGALHVLLPVLGFEIPFIILLLFGAIISSTDPVAVLALFKEFGAPKRLTLIFEGESLFNDGTAVALFMVILAIAANGYSGTETIISGVGMFISMVVLGVLLGMLMALVFSRALRFTRSNEFVSITLLIVSAHIVFILGELINEYGLFGLKIHVSSIIATTIAALFLGNYSRHVLSPKSDEYLEKSIEHLAFVANSLVFLLAGILFASTRINITELWAPILLSILVVAAARAISVFAVLTPLNKFKLESPIPLSWQALLAWGSLRGALAIIIVLLIPPDLMLPGWELDHTPQQFLLALTIGCILATLFIKALTIGMFMSKLGINTKSPREQAHQVDLGLYFLLTEKARFDEQKTRGFILDQNYRTLMHSLNQKIIAVSKERQQLLKEHGPGLFEQSLRYIAINIEQQYLKELYHNNEVSEAVYRKLRGKLTLQGEKILKAEYEDIDPSLYLDRKDVFDRMILVMQSVLERKKSKQDNIKDKLQYYRAQTILSRKVIKNLSLMQSQYDRPVFIPEIYIKVIGLYESYRRQSSQKVDDLLAKYPDELMPYTKELSEKSLHAAGNKALNFLHEKGIASEQTLHIIERESSVMQH